MKIDGLNAAEWVSSESVLVVEWEETDDGETITRSMSYVEHKERIDGEIKPAWPPIPDGATVEVQSRE